ncbi:MAG: hypothetical protein V2A56_02090 [bacterium]
MRKRRIQSSWMVVTLALGLTAFGTGCSSDSTDNGTGPVSDPNTPELVGPADGTSTTLSSSTRFELEWSTVDSAFSYHVQVAGDAGFAASSVINDEEIEGTSYDLQLTRIRFGTTYYWRAASILSDGSESDFSSARSFTLNAPSVQNVEILSGEILTSTTLDASTTYLLRGGVFVGKDDARISVTLTIPAGTTILGEKATDGMLVIRRGSMINAEGTKDEPIVFTSDQSVGSRARGDWGGVIINGRATLNTGAEAYGEGDTGPYGGSNDADNSGTMRYTRIEFAGREISPDNELNGLALQGVGSGTTIDYLQVHMNDDDGIEFFGGSPTAKHIFITGCADDQFDWTDGFHGKGQFWVALQFSDAGNRGFEADNSADNNTATPYSNPTIYNFTVIGNGAPECDHGMLYREGTKVSAHNGIITGFLDGIRIQHDMTIANYEAGTLSVTNSIFYDNTTNWHDDATSEDAVTNAANLNDQADPGFSGDPQSVTTVAGIAPTTTGLAATKTPATPPSDGFFEAVDYIGGLDPSDNWLEGWTTLVQN